MFANKDSAEPRKGFLSKLRARLNKGDSWLTYDLANLAPVAIGTETNGSIMCPSAVNGIVGLKPSRAGIALGTNPHLGKRESNLTAAQCTDPSDNIYCITPSRMCSRETTDRIALLSENALGFKRANTTNWAVANIR